jgi:hypothetical protein
MYEFIDGKVVWDLHATHGLPIEFSIPIIALRGQVPTWESFFRAAKTDGANLRRLADRVAMAVKDSYPRDFALEVEKRLPLLLDYIDVKDHSN